MNKPQIINTKEVIETNQDSSNGHTALPKSIAKANEQLLAKGESVGSSPTPDANISKKKRTANKLPIDVTQEELLRVLKFYKYKYHKLAQDIYT